MQRLSRRRLLFAAGATLAAARITPSAQPESVPKLLDHILIGSPDLDQGIAFIENITGVRAAFGGVHPGAGTRNALLSLGTNRYLEIIAPDPQQPESADTRDLRSLVKPAIVGWAAHLDDIEVFARRLNGDGIETIGPTTGSRKRPDGRLLTWKTLALTDDFGGLLPFFIEWGIGSIHPSIDSPPGCKLELFEAVVPDSTSQTLASRAARLNLDLRIAASETPHLHAVVAGPRGRLDIAAFRNASS